MPLEVSQTGKRTLAGLVQAAFLVALFHFLGCSRKEGPNILTPQAGRYGPPQASPSASIGRVESAKRSDEDWSRAPFACVQTELSPATLYHSSTKYLGFFTHLAEYGLGPPTFAAFNTPTGPRIYTNGEPMDVRWVEENWVLVWFAGAKGWTNWDSPWVVYLQHKPSAIRLDQGGLHFEFKEAAGDVVLMPLYGYEKASPKGQDFLAAHGLPSNKIRTWEWARAIPREPLMRVKYWSSATREFPLYCEDSFSVNRAQDTVTIRQRFQWHSIDDDWKTRHIKVAPVSPPLALASMDKQFPVEFSKPVMDYLLFTPYGPYMGVENADSFDATFKVLQYVNETEAYDPPQTTNHPTVQAALDRLRKTARGKFPGPEQYLHDHGGLENFCWAILGDVWYAKGLPYYDDATRSNAVASLRKYFHDEVLVTNRFKLREFPKGSGRNYYILEGPGIGSWGVLGDAGKFSADLLETLWAYSHFTGDWDLIKDRWDIVKKLFCTPAETRWIGFGRDAIAELGDEAAPCLAMARMAYKVGDIDTYDYACYMFARELVHHYVKQRGAAYYRQHQPWHSMEFMDEEVYLTNLWGDLAAWQIDGPNYPNPGRAGVSPANNPSTAETPESRRDARSTSPERQSNNRWVRFKNEDVARFYRDLLQEDIRRELDRLEARWNPKRKYHNDSHIMPSEVQLRSLLLNETPAQLARVATPDQFSGPPSGIIASCISVLRSSHPTRSERLIPAGDPTPFVAGLEREVSAPNPYLAQAIQTMGDKGSGASQPIWPEVTWWKSWKTPSGHRWSLGQVTPVPQGAAPSKVHMVPLSWNTDVLVYALP